jgi:hypothetical protein
MLINALGDIGMGPWADNSDAAVYAYIREDVANIECKGNGSSTHRAFSVKAGGWAGSTDVVAAIYGDGHAKFNDFVEVGSDVTGISELKMANSKMSLADDATYTCTGIHSANTSALVCISTNYNNSGSLWYLGGLFFVTYHTSTIVELGDPTGEFAVTDTDNRMCIYKSNMTGDFTIKNRMGQTNNVAINIIHLRGI